MTSTTTNQVVTLLMICALTAICSAGPEEPPFLASGLVIGGLKMGFAIYEERTDVVIGNMHHWFMIHWTALLILLSVPFVLLAIWIVRGRIKKKPDAKKPCGDALC